MANGGGLDGMVVAETKLSDVDGERGRLVMAGQDVERWAPEATFEAACELLLGGSGWRDRLAGARSRAFERLPSLGHVLSAADGMEALRSGVAQWPSTAEPEDLLGAAAVIAAAWCRAHEGQAPMAPDPAASHAADLLRMARGGAARPDEVRTLDTYLCTVVDHGMNASTFAARVVASTGSDLTSAITAAIGALKGPLHGGAPGPVLDMLDAVGVPARADAWIATELSAGRRIMGMGHRVYRVRDPRAAVLEGAIERLRASGKETARLELARALERAAERALAALHPERPLKANVEFYTAVLLEAVGLPRAAFSAVFAAARTAGWCAHVAEQRVTGRLIRPQSKYVGPAPVTPAQPG
jgi:citrate synthase